MAFSFVRAFLASFLPKHPWPEEPEDILAEKAEEDWLEPEKTSEQPTSLTDGFLNFNRWLFATTSHHVNAARYFRDSATLEVSYKRGDHWSYDPVPLNIAEKFADDLLGGSPGTDVWDYLRKRGTRHEHIVNARMIAGAPDFT